MIELTDVPVDILFKPMPFKIILLYLTQIQGWLLGKKERVRMPVLETESRTSWVQGKRSALSVGSSLLCILAA